MAVRIRTYLAAICAAALMAPVLAQEQPLGQPIPLDPTITAGTFDNGLRYFIRANTEPAKRAELRLVVNVGSIVEADDQQGLAHFVEHMAFNGTANFPKQALVAFMESIGMRFGPSVNAYTSFDETVYMLQIPTDKPEVIETSFQILEDWAHGQTLDGEEIDKERGVIIEEWRLRRGADARMQERQFPILLKGSQYAERIPIGKTDILESFAHDRLRAFYRDWYRPDLMAVIAVGDFDKAAVEGLVRKHFASIPKPAAPQPRPAFPVPDHDETLFAIATDPEASMTSVAVYSKLDIRDQSTYGAYRQSLVEGLFSGMLSARLAELAQKPDAPFMAAGTSRGQFVRTKEGVVLTALAKDDAVPASLATLFREAERVTRHGFTGTELDRQRTNVLRSFERAVTERRNVPSAQLAAEYIRHYLQGEPVPGIELEFELAGRFLPEITLDEVNGLARDWLPASNRVVMVNAPEKAGVAVPTEAELTAVMAAVADEAIAPYEDAVGTEPLLDPLPEPGRVTAETPASAFGISEWTLSNGIRVVLMPTTFKDDEIVFRAFSPGGTSLASDEAYVAARTASLVIGAGTSGLGDWSAIDLRKKLTGRIARVSASIGQLEESLSGSASKQDLETMFQLVHLTFTRPRADAQIFQVLTQQHRMLLANQMNTPGYAFSRALSSALTQDHPRARPLTLEDIDRMDLDASMAFYKDRFADAGDFTFIFAGSFEPGAMKPLVERYLASLPATERTETWRDVGVTHPDGIVTRRVEKGLEPQSRAAIVFAGPMEYTRVERNALRAMASILQTRLRETLREDLGGTYSVGVGASYERIPRPDFSVSINFGSAPERNDALIDRVYEEIARLQDGGPTPQELSDAIEQLVRAFEENMEQNSFLVAQLYFRYRDGMDVAGLFSARDDYRTITAAEVQAAAKKYLTTDRYVKVQLFPEKG
jgi:zinc protease